MGSYYEDGIFGLIIGDVSGRPYEYENIMVEVTSIYEKFDGIFTDDSSLTLASLDGLKDGYDLNRVMENFTLWLYEGKYSSLDFPIGIGNSTRKSIERFNEGYLPWESGGIRYGDNGNGSLMRILPFVLYHYKDREALTMDEIIPMIERESSLTHAHYISKIACGIYTFIIFRILDNRVKDLGSDLNDLIFKGLKDSYDYYSNLSERSISFSKFSRLFDEDFINLDEEEISSDPYVVNTLETVIYSSLNTKSYDEAILKCINFSKDTDTTSAICGGLCGIYYGIDYDLVEKIKKVDRIKELIRTNYEKYGRKYES